MALVSPPAAQRRIKPLVKRALAERARRSRRPPVLRTGPQQGPPTIYYLTPDHPAPSGGIRAMYRHVDLLRAAGREAAILHHREGFACTWFEHATRVTAAPAVTLGPEDVLVVPEIYGPFVDRLPAGPRLIAFNQNAYLTFDRVPAGQRVPYERFELAVTVSEDSAEYLRFAFDGLDVRVVPNAIDPALFKPAADPPGRRIALMPRKRPDEADQVLRLLGTRLDGWVVDVIEGGSERETAERLRAASVFLAFGHREGFGLPAAEAMASGCYVVGFPAFGGRELFDPAFSCAVEDGDVLALARATAGVLEQFERDPAAVRQMGAEAMERIRANYAPDRQRRELLRVFDTLR